MAGDIHHKAMADPPRRADAGVPRDHGAHQLVGMQAALHQGLGFPLPDELDRFGGRIVAVRRLHQREARYVGFRLLRRVANARGRPDQDRGDQPNLAASTTPSIEILIAGMRNRRRYGRQLLRGVHEPVVSLAWPVSFGFHRLSHPSPAVCRLVLADLAGADQRTSPRCARACGGPPRDNAPRAASTRRTKASASSHCRRSSGNSLGSAAIARSAIQ